MCEHTEKLIASKLVAWMDGELPESEAAAVEEHVAQCAECRECLAAYKQASGAFDMYCDAMVGVAEEARVAVFFQRDPNRVVEEPRAEGAARQRLLSWLKPRPTNTAALAAGRKWRTREQNPEGAEEEVSILGGRSFSSDITGSSSSGALAPEEQPTGAEAKPSARGRRV